MHLISEYSETVGSLEELSERLGPHIGRTIRLDNPRIPSTIIRNSNIGPMVCYGTLRWFRFKPGVNSIRLNMDRSFDFIEGEKSDVLWLESTLSVLIDGAWKIIHRPAGADLREG